ncbi:secretion system protein [Methanoculleus sp. Afa-1]|uniref:Secretion system protein n=1 Tax=Methanoculleus formosensis TaxID=2590886 RepID=A0A9E4ZKV3_9EURY|nr:type II secretion system F family protein [Methanoculleus sp. Afa-1]MCT8336190.1 secretion system protein [Methanoculleus sp. Afa-1]
MILPPCARIQRNIRWLVERDPIRYRSLREDMVAANMGVTLDRYLLRAFILSGLFGAFWAILTFLILRFSVIPQVSIGIYNVFAIRLPAFMLVDPVVGILQIIASIVVFAIAAHVSSFLFLQYPSIIKKNREVRINLLLHHAVAYMYAMRQGGAEMMGIFRAISENSSVYGEASHEFRRVVRDADYFGYDQITALRHLQETTPSEKLREFIQDLISVVESGGNMLAFLDARVRIYQEEARFEQKTFLSTLQLVAEGYVTLFVAGPLFIIIVMVVMGFTGSTSVLQLSIVIYLLVPVGSLFFILFLDMISIKTEGIERYTDMRWLNEFDDVRTVEQTGDEPLIQQMQYYDRIRNIRGFLRHPLQAFLIEPTRTFYVTVPIALVYVLLAFFATPAYTDIEVLIDVLDDHVIVALLIILVPFGIFHWFWQKTVLGLEAAIPDFLHRLSGINQVGLTLAQAITIVVKADLGVLTYEIKKVKRDIEWGASVQDALVRFEERIRTPTIARAVTLITTASRMTGGIVDVLNIAARDAAMSEALKRERRAEMFIYVAIVYLVFIVFILVVAVIDAQFLSVLAGVNVSSPGGMPGGSTFGTPPIMTFERLLFHACLIQAFFSGMIAGEMGEGSLRAGVKHAAVMIFIAFLIFTIFL